MAPPLERIERREEPKAQGGEFVEVDDCKRMKQISHCKLESNRALQGYGLLYPPERKGLFGGVRGVCGDTSATSTGSEI